jgi:predicted RNA-binding Zn ribbon-like protein
MVTRSQPDYVWDFCGGDLAVDFTNTIGSRGGATEEHFNVYGDVVSWAEARGVVGRSQAQRLRAEAERHPRVAEDAVKTLVELRESLYRLIVAAVHGRPVPPRDLAALNAHVAAVYDHARLAAGANGFMLRFDAPAHSALVDAIATPVVRAAVDLLTTDALKRVRLCADHSCAWLFVDSTRSGTRRWCDMKVCGNRNKVRRFRRRGATN